MSQSGPRRPAPPVYIPPSFGLTCKEAVDGNKEVAKMGVNITVLKDGKTQTMDLEEYEATQPEWVFSWFTDMDTVLEYVDHIGGAGGVLFVPDDEHRWYPYTIGQAGLVLVVCGLLYLICAFSGFNPYGLVDHVAVVGWLSVLVVFVGEAWRRRMWGSRFTRDQIAKACIKRGRKRRAGRATIGDLTAVVDVTGGELSVCEQGQLTGVER